jgi:phosphopantetheinyl transferase
MPLFYQHNINQATKLAVWDITETEIFFQRVATVQTAIHHPHKRLQHLAGRYLLRLLDPKFPLHLIEITDSKKPLLSNEEYHFSISHCGDFAAAIISANEVVGIDVELIRSKISSIKNKFLSATEQNLIPVKDDQMLTLLWSCKEAVYKWYGKGGVDFKKHIVIENIALDDQQGIVICSFMKEKKISLEIHCHLFRNLCLAWVAF